ncbi:MAG: hypothetical protein KKH41_08570 [Candidatus Thermoplasmatota archaeon]|nr:hypothetical protein [Euryarchaeota archaeon]MBU4032495.1 hypothetical protein [Candidatus Thermoplasmatota archaeon]MBU4070985.1 hypothetical protein [Candidatus Thermoplasmatota archaeon]MBU4144293.1 hypothetical protein [Candidatus Thermoplasmatota archaeon]MBU4592617.1 hypothetical protein [Candidatus Thermoplasmatota archaeon]
MSRKFICVLLLLLIASLSLQPISKAQATSTMTISMGDIEKTTVVAGIIHNITVSLSQASDDVVLRAYLASGFTAGSKSNNYSWSYSAGAWADDIYDYYMMDDSARYANNYCFYVAVDSQAVASTWRFVVLVDGVEIQNKPVTVETPVAGISMSAPTFYFNVIPYGTGYISSWVPNNATASEYLTTRNTGNVPLNLYITFESVDVFGTSQSFGATNSTGTYLPKEQRIHYVDFQAQSWSPRKFTVKGFISGEPQLLMTPDTVSTIIAPRTTFDVVVTVARPGYQVFQMDGVTVQYKSFYYSAYKRSITLDMYLTGNKSVYMGQSMQNLTFNGFMHDVTEYDDEFLLALSDNVEQHVTVNVTCSSQPPWKQPSMIAYANFNMRLADDSRTGSFTSNVVVSATAETETPLPISASVLVIIILAVIFISIGLILFRVYKKSEEERRRELEDRIRKKKEKAKKQRRN